MYQAVNLVKDFEGGGVSRLFGIAALDFGEFDAGARLVKLGNLVDGQTDTGLCNTRLAY